MDVYGCEFPDVGAGDVERKKFPSLFLAHAVALKGLDDGLCVVGDDVGLAAAFGDPEDAIVIAGGQQQAFELFFEFRRHLVGWGSGI